jgi:predicted Zn-dependent protease
MQEKEGAGLPNFLSTHPDPGDRLRRIADLAEQRNIQGPLRIVDPGAYLSTLDGIVFGEDPRQGFVDKNTFYHPELGFRFPVPRGFRVINQPAQLVMVEANQRAMIGFQLSRETSLALAARQFASQGRGRMKVLDSGSTRSEDSPAFFIMADAQAGNNQTVRLIAYWVEHRGRVYEFLAYAAPQAFGSFQAEFLRTMRGFGNLTNPEILRKHPVRVKIEHAARSVPFRELIPARLPAGLKLDDLAILNQVTVEQPIGSGQAFKLLTGS